MKVNNETEEIINFALCICDIENMYLSEEENYVKKMTNMSSWNWQEISLGEKSISETIDLWKYVSKKEMSKDLFHAVNMQIRLVVLHLWVKAFYKY